MTISTSRRNLLITSLKGVAGIAAASLVAPLLSCQKSSAANEPMPLANKSSSAQCPEQSLSEQEQSIRSSLRYVDQSPIAQKTCANCKIYTLPNNNSLCGGCKIVPGPIHPQGYCTAWIARM